MHPLLFDFLLKPGWRLQRHGLLLLIVVLITVNILWDNPVEIHLERLGVWCIYFLLFVAITYVNRYLLVPRFLLNGRAMAYVLWAALLIVLFIFALGMLQGAADGSNLESRPPAVIGIVSSVAAFALFVVGLTSLQLFVYRIRNQQRIQQLESATMAVELANLQHQINPHFLFNMLNNAHIMAGADADQSAEILSSLNQLLRYQVENGSRETVKLSEDIAFFEDFLALEKMRRDRFDYQIDREGDMQVEVPPLLFIPFIENAVKHNPGNDASIAVVFRVTRDKLYFKCENPKTQSPSAGKLGGIGLANVRRRLDLLYKDDYTLHIVDKAASYHVQMEIKLG